MFQNEDPDHLTATLDRYAVPMFIADRRPGKDWRLQCVNAAHSRLTGMTTASVHGLSPHDLLDPHEADAVTSRYSSCINRDEVIHYGETLHIAGRATRWQTTLQPAVLPTGGDRVIGTALHFQPEVVAENGGDADYFAAIAQMQFQKVQVFLDSLENRADLPLDARQKAMMVAGLMRSLDHVLSDVRRSLPMVPPSTQAKTTLPQSTVKVMTA